MAIPFPPPNTASEMALLADRCVQCGLCLPHCPTYQLDRSEAESPRGRIAYMKALAIGAILPTAIGDKHLDHCLGCLRCESACPADVEYDALLGLAREQQFLRQSPPRKLTAVQAVIGKPRLLRMAGALGRFAGRLPALPENSPRRQSAPLVDARKVALFTGCIADAYETNTRLNLESLLNAAGFSVEPAPGQTCCGAAAVHLGDSRRARVLAEKNRAAFDSGIPVLSLATGCHGQLSASLKSQNKVIDALDFIFSHAANLNFRPSKQHIALHIPCSQSSVVKSDDATRKLLAMVPDLHIHFLPDQGCCGGAGLHLLSEPERANRLRKPILEDIRQTNVTLLLSANIGCRLHLANGLKIPVRHPIDFLAEHLA